MQCSQPASLLKRRITMAKGQVRSNREAKKPKKEKPKVAASAPSLTKIATPPKVIWNKQAAPIKTNSLFVIFFRFNLPKFLTDLRRKFLDHDLPEVCEVPFLHPLDFRLAAEANIGPKMSRPLT